MKVVLKGRKFNAELDERGMFVVDTGQGKVTAESLKELKKALLSKLKLKPLNISVIGYSKDYWNKEEIRRGIITGKHSSNRNLLVKWDGDASTQQVSCYGYELFCGDMDLKKFESLKQKAKEAEAEFDTFKSENGIDSASICDTNQQEKIK